MITNNSGVVLSARKVKRRKGRYIKGYARWMGIHKETQQRANRHSRRQKIPVLAKGRVVTTPDQGKQNIASNRCGNECGRRAIVADYLCIRCRT